MAAYLLLDQSYLLVDRLRQNQRDIWRQLRATSLLNALLNLLIKQLKLPFNKLQELLVLLELFWYLIQSLDEVWQMGILLDYLVEGLLLFLELEKSLVCVLSGLIHFVHGLWSCVVQLNHSRARPYILTFFTLKLMLCRQNVNSISNLLRLASFGLFFAVMSGGHVPHLRAHNIDRLVGPLPICCCHAQPAPIRKVAQMGLLDATVHIAVLFYFNVEHLRVNAQFHFNLPQKWFHLAARTCSVLELLDSLFNKV